MSHTIGKHSRPAFSLVEILIVVVILGILASIAIPKFANASQSARESTLKEDLRLLRTQIGVYRTQHNEVNPGYPGGDLTQNPTPQTLSDQLTLYSDLAGNTSATGSSAYPWGAYVTTMPVNPVNNLATFKILQPSDSNTPDGSTGWLYQPASGMVWPNLVGADSTGRLFSDY